MAKIKIIKLGLGGGWHCPKCDYYMSPQESDPDDNREDFCGNCGWFVTLEPKPDKQWECDVCHEDIIDCTCI